MSARSSSLPAERAARGPADAGAAVVLVARAFARPLLVLTAVPLLAASACVVVGVVAGSAPTVGLGRDLAVVVLGGLVAPVLLHEAGHATALTRLRPPVRIEASWSWTRFSIASVGERSPWGSIGVALAGPLPCAAVGGVLLLLAGRPVLGWLFLLHLVNLVPPLGDGRVVWRSLRTILAARDRVRARVGAQVRCSAERGQARAAARASASRSGATTPGAAPSSDEASTG